jgi:putative tricarboxylic transport membrane protein
MSYSLGFGEMRNPGAGLVPFGTAAVLGLMSIGLILRSLLETTEVRQEGAALRQIRWNTVLLVLCGLVGFGLFFDIFGFRISTFLLMVLLFGVVGRQKWWFTFGLSFLTVSGAYLIFVVWLGCQFPKGFFGI